MSRDVIISIDPGESGAVVELRDGEVTCHKLSNSMTENCDLIRRIAATDRDVKAILERVGGYMPGNSGPAATTFARHVGHIEAALYLWAVPIIWNPTPQQWMKRIGVPAKMEKGARKKYIKDWAARRYPNQAVTLWNADALAMLAAH